MSTDVLPYVYRVTKYDPADRDADGCYLGAEAAVSDHGPVEAAYLAAVAAFAEDSGVHRLAIREPEGCGLADPEACGVVCDSGDGPSEGHGHGLAGLLPPDLASYHDGAEVALAVGLELVRGMLREGGLWCRLEVEGRFFIHVGWDQYVYVGSDQPCSQAVTRTRDLGLFPERLDASPYDPERDETPARRPADAAFWTELASLAAACGAVLLEEGYVANASRWHRLTVADGEAIRVRLTPRARLWVWPDLSPDLAAVLADLPDSGLATVVWADRDGRISGQIVDEEGYARLPGLLADARAATILPLTGEDRHPLLTAVLPDADGVLRARWAP